MPDIASDEFWTKKGDVSLYVYRKQLSEPARDGAARPVFFLVHGSSFGGRTSFDLIVDGRNHYSMMDHFAERGFDVWTMDHEGYSRSDRTDGNSDIASGVADLECAMEIVERETGRRSVLMYGQSSGALRAAAYAEAHPDRVDRVILDAFVWTGKDAPTLIKRAEKLDEFRAHNVRPVDQNFYESIFTRDKPGTSEPHIGKAIADVELQFGDTVPSGTYLDMCANLPLVDPEKVECPVLIVRGEHDGIATEEDLINFFRLLPNTDKQFVVVAGQAHSSTLGINRHRFFHIVEGFITFPARLDR
ncbi:MAG: alpha/beta fold hydrolase [Pseudomonadota bacterium]